MISDILIFQTSNVILEGSYLKKNLTQYKFGFDNFFFFTELEFCIYWMNLHFPTMTNQYWSLYLPV